jgi:hypothetical protein
MKLIEELILFSPPGGFPKKGPVVSAPAPLGVYTASGKTLEKLSIYEIRKLTNSSKSSNTNSARDCGQLWKVSQGSCRRYGTQ